MVSAKYEVMRASVAVVLGWAGELEER